MRRARQVSEYPWTALDRLDAALERALRAARRSLEPGLVPAAFARALSELVGAEVELHVLSIDGREPDAPLVRVGFGIQGGTQHAVAGLEAALVSALLAKLLRRPIPVGLRDTAADATLMGAVSALLCEAARRTGATRPLVPREIRVPPGSVVVHLTAIVEGRPYAAALWLAPPEGRAQPAADERVKHLRDVELALPLVVAQNLGGAGVLARLERGAAWCPGDGWMVGNGLEGRGVLVAGDSERGLGVELGPRGKIVLREPTTAALTGPESMANDSDDSPEPSTLPQAVLDAPLVVRVELGAVSMKAREWAALRTGDVIETGRRIAEPVLLRAGGRVLARGELVNIEGELGVRITDVMHESE